MKYGKDWRNGEWPKAVYIIALSVGLGFGVAVAFLIKHFAEK